MTKIGRILMIGAFLIFTIAGAGYAQKLPSSLKICTASQGTTFYAMGAVFADVFTRNGVSTSILPGGGTQNVMSIALGKADLGFSSSVSLMDAHMARAPYKQKYPNVVVLARFDISPFQAIVPADSPIKTIQDLRGKKLAGPSAGSSAQGVVRDVLKACGINEDKDLKLVRGSMSEAVELMKDGHVEGFVIMSGAGNATILDLTTAKKCRFIPLPKDIVERARKINLGYSQAIIKAKTYPGLSEDYITVGSNQIFIINAKAPEEQAYWIVKTLVDNWGDIQKTSKWLRGVTVEEMGDTGGLPTHPGAVKFYKEFFKKK